MSENAYILTIIAKQLKAQASAAELQELNNWLQADASHQAEYEELMSIWHKSGDVLSGSAFDTRNAWARIEKQIRPPQPVPIPKKITPVISISIMKRTAIAVVLLTTMCIGAYWWYNRTRWQTFTATGANQLLRLPDQSVVHVRKGSIVRYPGAFADKERAVQLTGEAFFEVRPREEQPFHIATVHSDIRVLGTSFLVNSQATSDVIAVVTGRVQVQDKNNDNNQVIVPAGQRVVLQQHRFLQDPITDSNFISWKTGHLVFVNAPLQKVLEDLGHYYGVPVELDAANQRAASALHITVRFDNQPLDQAVEEIRLIAGLGVKKENGKITFYQK